MKNNSWETESGHHRVPKPDLINIELFDVATFGLSRTENRRSHSRSRSCLYQEKYPVMQKSFHLLP